MEKDLSIIFTDHKGINYTNLINNDSEVTFAVDGTFFTSSNLIDFKPSFIARETNRFLYDKNGMLTNYTLEIEFPYQINKKENLTIKVSIKATLSKKNTNQITATFKIVTTTKTIDVGMFDNFETAFKQINKIINTPLTCCFNCLYSDYSIYGQDFWGSMFCFKNNKKEYLKVKTKNDYSKIMNKNTLSVQETFYCNQFKKRNKGTSYRG